MATITTTNIKLMLDHEGQARLKKKAKRFNVVCCGRRWGKTEFGKKLAVESAVEGKLVGWFADTYKRIDETFHDLVHNILPKEVIASKDATKRIIRLVTGGVIEFWSCEEDDNAARSRKYHRVIIDEAGLLTRLDVVWREAIRATLIDFIGDAWILGTPKPPKAMQLKDYPFYIFFQRHLTRPELWASFTEPSKHNPFLSEDEINEMRHEPGMTIRIAKQEIDAQFLSESTDALWKMSLIEPYRRRRPDSVKKLRTVLFLDPGNFSTSDSADPCGIVIACKGDDGHYYVENDLSGAYTPNQCSMLVVNASEHYGAKVYFESNQGGEFVKAAIRNVAPISVTGIPSNQGKEQRALAPLGCYEMGLVHHEYEFVDMEQEMVNWNPYDKKMPSPNRMDALVGALNVLMKTQGMGTKVTNRVHVRT